MAERNPTIPSERRKDVEARSSVDERESTAEYTEKQARLNEKQRDYAVHQAVEDAQSEASAPGEDNAA